MKTFNATLALLLLISNNLLCQWFSQNSGTPFTLYTVDFLTETKGWIAGAENMIKQSNNGGESWENYSGYTTPPHEVWYSVCFVSLDDIYVCGKTYNYDRYQSNWTFSTNSGVNWSSQTSWGSDYSGWLDAFFFDQNIGYKVGYRSGDGRCYKTSGGVAGEWQLLLTTEEFLNSVFFINENNGWVVGDNGVIYISTNGGVNWEIQTSNTSKSLKSVYFIDATTGWIVGHDVNNAVILKTTNGGQIWSAISPPDVLKLNCISFANPDVGWTCGSIIFEEEERGAILYTENGGESWEVQHIENSLSILYDIDFVNNNTGWVVGTDGILLKTTNGGVTDIGDESNTMLQGFSLAQNYPNPFNPTTRISYTIPQNGNIKLILYNTLGEVISVLVNEHKYAGKYIVEFNAGDLSSGVYFYRIEFGSYFETKKLVLLR